MTGTEQVPGGAGVGNGSKLNACAEVFHPVGAEAAGAGIRAGVADATGGDATAEDATPADTDQNGAEVSPGEIIKEYLCEHIPFFKALAELKQKGWENPAADHTFKKKERDADNADEKLQKGFFKMMRGIAQELNAATGALRITAARGEQARILDLCMAPGGFSAAALGINRKATLCALTLPLDQGGHKIRLHDWMTKSNIHIKFLDVTMLAAEMGVEAIPQDHPEAHNFLSERPYLDQKFHLVFCDGQVLRNTKHARAEYREPREAWRLKTSQLVLALQRIATGGTLVVLAHRADGWDTITLLHTLSRFSQLQLVKPLKAHRIRSSFYIVAQHVQPESPAAKEAVEYWKSEWNMATFASEQEYRDYECGRRESGGSEVRGLLESFGARLVELTTPVFEVQRAALEEFIEKLNIAKDVKEEVSSR